MPLQYIICVCVHVCTQRAAHCYYYIYDVSRNTIREARSARAARCTLFCSTLSAHTPMYSQLLVKCADKSCRADTTYKAICKHCSQREMNIDCDECSNAFLLQNILTLFEFLLFSWHCSWLGNGIFLVRKVAKIKGLMSHVTRTF